MYTIGYHPSVVSRDIPALGTAERIRIKKAIEAKLTQQPALFGVPLRQSLKGYYKLRVGSYRIIFRIEHRRVLIFLIAHRSRAYEAIESRLQR